METVWQDVRHALRCLRRAPAFTSAVVLTTVSFVGTPFFLTPVALAACRGQRSAQRGGSGDHAMRGVRSTL